MNLFANRPPVLSGVRAALGDPAHRVDEDVDFVVGVVERERRSDGGFHTHTAQDGLGAVVAGAHGDALGVEGLADFDGVVSGEHEGQHAGLLIGGPDQSHPGDDGQPWGGVFQQGVFVGGDPVDALWNMVFAQPLLLLGIAAVVTVWAYWLGVWRKRHAYVRHDGRTLYRGGAASWPLIAIRDVIIVRGELGAKALRLVVDDDSEVTRELVKLYLLSDRAEVVRDAVMFAVARAGGAGVPVSVH